MITFDNLGDLYDRAKKATDILYPNELGTFDGFLLDGSEFTARYSTSWCGERDEWGNRIEEEWLFMSDDELKNVKKEMEEEEERKRLKEKEQREQMLLAEQNRKKENEIKQLKELIQKYPEVKL